MNEITVYDSSHNTINHLYQYDSNITIYIDKSSLKKQISEVHFTTLKMSEALSTPAIELNNSFKSEIPNQLLLQDESILVYFVAMDDNGETQTIAQAKIPIRKRPRPSEYVFENNVEYVSVKKIESEINELSKKIYSANRWQKIYELTSEEEVFQFEITQGNVESNELNSKEFNCDKIRVIISIPKVKKAFSGFIKYAPDEIVYWDDEEVEDDLEHSITPYSEKSWTSTTTNKVHIFEADLNGRLELMSLSDAMYMINGKPEVAWYQPTYTSASERPHIIGYDSMIQSLGYILIGCDEGYTYPVGTHIEIWGMNCREADNG